METATLEENATPAHVQEFRDRGYVIIRGFASPAEIAELRGAFDRAYAEGQRLGRTWRHQNRLFWVNRHPSVGIFVSGCQWQAWADPVIDRFRTHPKLLALLAPLIGDSLKQIINQMHWKVPGTGYTWGLHQDVRSRKPAECFRDLATSYVQTGLAIDRHWAGNGAMQVIPFSHRRGDLGIDQGASRHDDTREEAVAKVGIDPAQAVDVEMEPGDLALWGPYMIHGGGINRTPDSFRRLLINGYVTAANCDRGQPVWDRGEPLPLGTPALIQYDRLHERPEPHFPDDRASQQQRD